MKAYKALMVLVLFLGLMGIAMAATPILDEIGDKTITEGMPLVFQVTATADGEVGFSYTPLLAGATFTKVDGLTYSFNWTPNFNQAGTHSVTFTVYNASDASSYDSETISISVNENSAPTINAGSLTLDSDEDTDTMTISASDPDGQALTFSVVDQTYPEYATCSIEGSTLKVTRQDDLLGMTAKTTVCTIKVSDGDTTKDSTAAYTVTVEPTSMLEISKVEVVVDGDSHSRDEGDDFDVELGDSLEFVVTAKNLYTGDTDEEEVDIEDVNLEITIEGWDDGDDEEWDVDSSDIKYDKKDEITLSVGNVPFTIDDGAHTVTITLTGKDEETRVKYTSTWTIEMNVEKESEDIRVESYELSTDTVSCSRNIELSVTLVNAGTKDSDEIVFWGKGGLLGISPKQEEIDIDSGETEEIEFSLTIPSTVVAGTYELKMYTYFDEDSYDDNDISNLKTIQIKVEDCKPTTTTTTTTTTQTQTTTPATNESVVVVTQTQPTTTQTETQTTTTTETDSFWEDNKVFIIGGLVLLNVLLLVGIIALFAKLLSR